MKSWGQFTSYQPNHVILPDSLVLLIFFFKWKTTFVIKNTINKGLLGVCIWYTSNCNVADSKKPSFRFSSIVVNLLMQLTMRTHTLNTHNNSQKGYFLKIFCLMVLSVNFRFGNINCLLGFLINVKIKTLYQTTEIHYVQGKVKRGLS